MNVKGADVGVYIPDSTCEDQYRCMCGFSAIVNRRLAHGTGLFLEDELDIFGRTSEGGRAAERRLALCRRDPIMGDSRVKQSQYSGPGTPSVVIVIQEQCSQPISSLISLHLPMNSSYHGRKGALLQSWMSEKQWADASDACVDCFNALEQGLQYVDNSTGGKVDLAAVRSSAIHSWPHTDGMETDCYIYHYFCVILFLFHIVPCAFFHVLPFKSVSVCVFTLQSGGHEQVVVTGYGSNAAVFAAFPAGCHSKEEDRTDLGKHPTCSGSAHLAAVSQDGWKRLLR